MDKIICCDRGNNDNALAAAIMASGNRRDDSSILAASLLANRRDNNDGMWATSQWMNNPFAYMMMFGMMRFLGFDQNGNPMNGQNAQNIEMQNQLQAIRTQLQDNQNSGYILDAVNGGKAEVARLADRIGCNFDAVNAGICSVRENVKEVAGLVGISAEKVINSVLLGNKDIITALKDCCCNIRESISDFKGSVELQMCKDTGLLRDGQRDITAAVTEGFSTLGYRLQQDKCDIINNQNANKQAIIDTLKDHWNFEQSQKIQDLKNELSQERQNNYLLSRILGRNNNGGCCCNGNQYNEGF